MKSLVKILLVSLIVFSVDALANDGLIHVKSKNSFAVTTDKLNSILLAKGMTIFARVKHSESAKNVGVAMRPTELFIFGNPKIGSKIMHCSQSVAIDLPQKIIVWENEKKEVWLSYNDPAYLKERHTIINCDEILKKVSAALKNISNKSAN